MPVDMGLQSDLPDGGAKCATAKGKPFALFRVGTGVYCLDNTCTHAGGPLCQGELDGFTVTCPWHGSRFDIRTGQVVGPPARKAVRSYPVVLQDGRIWVDLP